MSRALLVFTAQSCAAELRSMFKARRGQSGKQLGGKGRYDEFNHS